MPDTQAATPESSAGDNRLKISGEVLELSALRRTPAGVPVQGFRFSHQSQQVENGLAREVSVELEAIAIGPLALFARQAVMGTQVRLEGFLAQKSLRNTKPILHVESIEFLEGH